MEIKVSLTVDEFGFLGRECPKCEEYFKVKPGTGLETKTCFCPYCEYEGTSNQFFTQDQLNYAESIAINEVLDQTLNPALRKLDKSLKKLDQSSKRGMIQFKTSMKGIPLKFEINEYNERDLETEIKCDNCNLEFAIYGVYSHCPDCSNHSAISIFKNSINTIQKTLNFSSTIEDKDLANALLESSLQSAVSTFDGYGKMLQKKYPILQTKTKNLFQKFDVLSNLLIDKLGFSTSEFIGAEASRSISLMFQVRHIYQHNMGAIDDDFVQKTGSFEHLLGRKYKLDKESIEQFSNYLLIIGVELNEKLKN